MPLCTGPSRGPSFLCCAWHALPTRTVRLLACSLRKSPKTSQRRFSTLNCCRSCAVGRCWSKWSHGERRQCQAATAETALARTGGSLQRRSVRNTSHKAMLSNVGAAAASRSGVWCSQRSMARHSTAVARLLAPPRLALAQRQGPCVCGLAVRIHASKRLFSGSSAHGGAPRAAPRVEKPRAATTPARAKRSQAGVVAALAAAGLLGTAGYQMYSAYDGLRAIAVRTPRSC